MLNKEKRILAVIVLLIAYGSLYPGNFSTPADGAIKAFLTDLRWFTSLGDVLGNIALFFPLGMASVIFLPNKPNGAVHTIVLLILAFVYSFTLQMAQIWLPSRSAALADVVWNMVGMILGMCTAHLIGARFPQKRENKQSFDYSSLVPLSMLALWLLSQLVPLAPSLDWQKFKDALKPLFLEFSFSLPEFLMHLASAFAAASAILALGRPLALWLGGALLLILAGKVVIVNLNVNASMVTGMLAGYLGCLLVLHLRGARRIVEIAFLALLIAWTIAGITPFSPTPGGTFNWIPFATMLEGSIETGARGLAQSLFIYTALLWLAQKIRIDTSKALMGLVVWSCMIELIQMGLLGRTADVTEPVLLLLVGFVLPAIQSGGTEPGWETGAVAASPSPQAAIPKESNLEMSIELRAELSSMAALARIAIGIAIWVAIAWVITKSPLTPYNVRELVYEGHPFRSLLLLGTLLYWSLGFPVLILQWVARGERYLLSFVPLVLLHGFIAWMLLWSAVPTESIHDVVGSPVLGWPWEWELLGRFVALFSIWSVAAAAGSLIGAWHVLSNPKAALLGWITGALLIMPFSYYVVVSEASTDNLVELMAGNGSIGSFCLISLAIAIITFGGTKAALASVPGVAHRIRAAMWVLVSGALAYVALYFGLEQLIVKYGRVFSAMQFLLSSDRAQLATPGELLLRYAVLYIGVATATTMIQHPLWRWIAAISARSTQTAQVTPASSRPG